MEWNYKNILISVDQEGQFCFYFNDQYYSYDTLRGAKARVDDIVSKYYTISRYDYKNMLNKLTKREREFLEDMMNELATTERSGNMSFIADFGDLTKGKPI